MRAAIVLAERRQERAALALAVGGVALQALEIAEHAVEVRAGLLDLVVDRAALRRLPAEQGEEAAAFAAHAPALRGEAVELGLLAVRYVLGPLDLGRARRIVVAAVERCELAFEPKTDRVALRGARRGAGIRRRPPG